jgi:hypothetical protein
MDSFQTFSSLGIALTALLGFYNLFLGVKSQRKTHRELVFQKQFDFFLNLQTLFARLQNSVSLINQSFANQAQTNEDIFNLTNQIDDLVDFNELIIPDSLYDKIDEFNGFCNDLCVQCNKNPELIDKELKRKFIVKNVDLFLSIRDFLGVDKLSKENVSLLNAKPTKNR